MPETSVDEDHLLAAGEHQVRPPGQLRAVQAVAVAQAVNEPADQHFGAGSLALDAGHAGAAFGGGEGVHGNIVRLVSSS